MARISTGDMLQPIKMGDPMHMKLLKLLTAAAASAAMFGGANAATFYLGGSNANLGKDEVFTSGPASLTATAINTQEPEAPVLKRSLLGLGVYSGDDDDGLFSGGDQIDNIGDDEALVLDFGIQTQFESMRLSLAGGYDDIEIYGSNNAAITAITSGGLSAITSISTLLVATNGNGLEGFKDIDLSGIANAYRYLIATIPGGSGDGFLVKYVSATPVPIPAALPLLLSGLAGLGFASRRRKTA